MNDAILFILAVLSVVAFVAHGADSGIYVCSDSLADGQCVSVGASGWAGQLANLSLPLLGPADIDPVFRMWYVPLNASAVNKTYHYRLAREIGIRQNDAPLSELTTSLSLNISDEGDIPTDEVNPLTFTAGMRCHENAVFAVTWMIAVHEADTDVLVALSVITFLWRCARPGCPERCGITPGGVCDYYEGVCQCAPNWAGEACTVRALLENATICPGDRVSMRVYIAGPLTGEEWFEFISAGEEAEYEWAYATTGSHTFPEATDAGAPFHNNTYDAGDFYGPGDYIFLVYNSDYNELIAEFTFNVLSYIECGLQSSLYYSGNCSAPDRGTVNAVDNSCSCADSTYWYDCSRGCSLLTNVTAAAGLISNDPLVPAEEMYYIQKSECTWNVRPEDGDWDVIDVTFDFIDIDLSDTLLLAPEGTEVDAITFTGTDLPPTMTVTARGFSLVLSSDYANARRGFVLRYVTRRLPLSVGAIVGIAVGASVAFIVVFVGLTFVTIRVHRQRKQAREKLANLPELAWTEAEEAAVGANPIAAELAADALTQLGVPLSTYNLAFGLSQNCPVNVPLEDTFIIRNHGKRDKHFCVRVNQREGHYSCHVRPGRGTLPARGFVVCHVTFTMECTCTVNRKLAVEIYPRSGAVGMHATQRDDDGGVEMMNLRSTDAVGFAYLNISLKGAPSYRLNPDEISLTHPIKTGPTGDVLKGLYANAFVVVKEVDDGILEKYARLYECVTSDHLVKFIGASYASHAKYVVTDLVRCGSLDRIYQMVRIPLELQMRFATDIAKALAYLHDNDIVYRALDPSKCLVVSTNRSAAVNIRLSLSSAAVCFNDLVNTASGTSGASGDGLVTQWSPNGVALMGGTAGSAGGMASVYNTSSAIATNNRYGARSKRCATAGVTGLPTKNEPLHKRTAFVAPELYDGSDYDTKVDSFSFAMTLWSMYHRTLPWAQLGGWQVQYNVMHGIRPAVPLPDPSQPGYQAYWEVITRCWNSDRALRPRMREICKSLDGIACTTAGFEEVPDDYVDNSAVLQATPNVQISVNACESV